MNPSAESGRLLRSNLVVAIGTALSRITGLIRIVVLSYVIGQTALADAYNAANNSPNAIYELLIGGVLSASLVPLFTRYAEQKDDEATTAVVTVSVVAMSVLTTMAVLAAPWVFHLYSLSPSSKVDRDQFRTVGTELARIFLIQIFFYGLSALGTSLLNARRRFFAAAWAPVLSNVVIIASLLSIPAIVKHKDVQLGDVLDNTALRLTLGLGATLGIAVMALALWPALRQAGVPLKLNGSFRHPAVKQLLRLSGWTLGYAAANQVAIIVVQNLALSKGVGQQDDPSEIPCPQPELGPGEGLDVLLDLTARCPRLDRQPRSSAGGHRDRAGRRARVGRRAGQGQGRRCRCRCRARSDVRR